LVIVDIQNDFCHADGFLGKLGAPLGLVQDMVPRLQRLVDSARAAGVLVVHVVSYHDEEYASVVVTEQKVRNGHDLREGDRLRRDAPYCIRGTFGAQIYEIDQQPGDVIVEKYRYSGFHGTNLDLVLRGHGIQTVILTGTATNVCVESTARDVYSHDYYLLMVRDCTATTNAADHEHALRIIDTYFGHVVSSDELIARWDANAAPEPAPLVTAEA
jgi:ureidoacrylate peracid hydrolase